ncbi:DUF771 domain-containing protein [Listeria monocytogenes]|uniref:DUF771 domain-containing protein n=1 Tax=Listeria monocytogenes TaxID=1639 RepID=A0A823DL18_LISMN|nr:DUF771 domain-containing protein [Listeria monocytogenes]EAD1012232.1 DUF771 domain-containing protein [Listeria monocytogenes]EAD1186139.1 DUF771 domain-containing protein [Listeria monocytogenes]EAF8898057.1 DUF771 domain-containing protein [Listeria monocytogenes]
MAAQSLSVKIEIPETHVIIPKEEYEGLLSYVNYGRWWSLKDLEDRVNKKRAWLEEKFLLKPSFKKILSIEENPDGFVKYPKGRGDEWAFQATKMSDFLEENFPEIMRGEI